MIIICPNCQTRYQVADKTIGSAGRKVQCAHCHQSWQAEPEKETPKPKLVETPPPDAPGEAEDDRLFDADDEAALDDAFAREEEKGTENKPAAKPRGKPDGAADKALEAALKKRRRKEMQQRESRFANLMPLGRMRGNARFAGVCLLALVIGGGIQFRTEVVRLFPDLAGIYAAVGMGVNVVGLEFRDAETLRALKNGADQMIVSARIQNITGRQVRVPSVMVSILDEAGSSLYSWRVAPVARSIGPREILEFETQLNAPPEGGRTVKLAFADGGAN